MFPHRHYTLIYYWCFCQVVPIVTSVHISPARSDGTNCSPIIVTAFETVVCEIPTTREKSDCANKMVPKGTIAEIKCHNGRQLPKRLACFGRDSHYVEWYERNPEGTTTNRADLSDFNCKSEAPTLNSDSELLLKHKNITTTKTSTKMREIEETTKSDYNGSILPVHPTRWPISTQKPKKVPVLTTTTTQKPTTTISGYDPKVVGVFVCPPLPQMTGVVYACQHGDLEEFDDCSNGGMIGTKATLTCDNFYKAAFGQDSTRAECQPNHRWSAHRMFGCNLECGISAKPRKSYIVNGVVSNRISWPWHATIFRRKGQNFYYICGGSLISKTLILTAAHCLTEPSTTTISAFDEFRILLAARTSNYTENLLDKISGMHLFHVQNITIPHSYNGLTFESDIAIVQLDRPVELSDYAKPVCFPFQSKENSDIELLHLSPGTIGQTIGFGIDETGNLSAVLKETSLPVISHRDCGEVLDRFPTHSQFCAGYRNGTSVCNGDSGGGIFFSEGTGIVSRFIIQGIVSSGNSENSEGESRKSECSEKTLAVFTKIGGFSAWVQQIMDKWDEPDFR